MYYKGMLCAIDKRKLSAMQEIKFRIQLKEKPHLSLFRITQ